MYTKDSKSATTKELMLFTVVYRESNSESSSFLRLTSKFENPAC